MSLRRTLCFPLFLLLLPGCREEPIDDDKDGFKLAEDCDDKDDTIHPGAEEVCGDAVDNNCDALIDDPSAVDANTWYADADGDGYGDPDTVTRACEAPSGFVADNTDCDDASADNHPDAEEICGDSIDNNCDALIDDPSAVDAYTWYEDADGDSWGNADSIEHSCIQPIGYVVSDGDCDDTDPAFNPSATENDCEDPNDYNCDGSVGYADVDADGFPACDDCDDSDFDRNASVDEICDDVDNDCDGDTDEEAIDAPTWYEDADGDTHGGTQFTAAECEAPEGYVASSDDCDDLDADAYPGNTEVCDEIDNDCDAVVDEADAADAATWYADVDGDGFGDAATSTVSCEQPSGYVEDATDCDDAVAATNPDATETCDGVDNDCDTEIDETDAEDASTWYADVDQDGYGDATSTTEACTLPSGYADNSDDCDDSESAAYPGGTEVCDDVDNDCNGDIDDDAVDAPTWYADADGDTHGGTQFTAAECDAPVGYVASSDDCDDLDADAYPGNTEVCDEIDNDCDAVVDEAEAADAATWYADGDGDGYGDSTTSTVSCEQPSGYVADATDCDDAVATTYPSASETCDGVDNDCDTETDENDADDVSTWYADTDADGYGEAATTTEACTLPSGYADNSDDCDDGNVAVNPGATEVCNAVDDDCDGDIDSDDSSVTGTTTFYGDADGDGYGGTQFYADACEAPPGYVSDSADCDDLDATSYPGGTEVCDLADNNCDGSVDEGVGTTWYLDADGDGYGDGSSTTEACAIPTSYVANATDCDDSSAATSPAAYEFCDGIDNDCDNNTDESDAIDADTWYIDDDGDGYGDETSTTEACEQPTGYVEETDDFDCDDSTADASPGTDESCGDGIDNDCDGETDEDDAADTVTWYIDVDGDGYGFSSISQNACSQPSGYVTDATDCDDDDNTAYPTNTEVCDAVDNDCDGTTDEDDATDATTWYLDTDEDGYGLETSTTVACEEPTGYVEETDDFDCDDSDEDVNPGVDELCDNVDNDCDGTTDEDDADDASIWYADDDGDGYGDGNSTTEACSEPTGYVSDDSDCDDSASSTNPGASEVCDSVDNDCDGDTDESVQTTYYADADSDSYGDAGNDTAACSAPSGYVEDNADCDDSNSNVNPGVDELCDGQDTDCDGETDEDDATDASTYYADDDGDGYGDDSSTSEACSEPSGYVSDDSDCDDTDISTYPGASEVCDSADNDCDGTTDEGVETTYYADADSDGYGDSSSTSDACSAPSGYIEDSDDCDDTNSAVNPGADETCDTVDNDCDGTVDEDDATDVSTWYADLDSDGYGASNSGEEAACSQPTGYVDSGGDEDCDDTNNVVNPGADELCDNVDNDCDGEIDEDDATDVATYYVDLDGDGYGDSSSTSEACSEPSGYVSDDSDCDDSTATVYPSADETCDSIDNDCDGEIDEDNATDASTYYGDDDGDGYGASDSGEEAACSAPSGYVENADDCDDTDASVYPSNTEVCDDKDNDCDGTTDEGVLTTYYADDDLDGYGDGANSTDACSAPSGYLEDNLDCDDTDANMNPANTEVCDGVDNDCDGETDEDDASDASTYYYDQDGDGYGDESTTTEACSAPTGYGSDDTDCDDDDPDAYDDNGASSGCAAVSCVDILDAGYDDGDGIYWIAPLGTAFQAYCDMSDDGGGWTLVAWIHSGERGHANNSSTVGDVTDMSGGSKLSDALTTALNDGGYWRYECGNSKRAYLMTDSGTFNSAYNNSETWWMDNDKNGVFECAASRSGYVFADWPACASGHSDYGAATDGTGCYVDGEGWSRSGSLWAR